MTRAMTYPHEQAVLCCEPATAAVQSFSGLDWSQQDGWCIDAEGCSVVSGLNFCPWCGTALPEDGY